MFLSIDPLSIPPRTDVSSWITGSNIDSARRPWYRLLSAFGVPPSRALCGAGFFSANPDPVASLLQPARRLFLPSFPP